MINIIPFNYDENIDRSNPSIYLNNFIKIIMPELAEQIQPILISDTDSTNSNKTFNPGINDRGIEIAKEHLGKVFDRLYRVPTGNVHDVKGFGLGLSYVKTVVDRHRGTIHVESEPGQGSTFILNLQKEKLED